MPNTEWDASQGTNPDTCLHMLVESVLFSGGGNLRVCFSCKSTIDKSYWDEFVWDYLIDSGVWKRRSARESARLFREDEKYDFHPFERSERFHGDDILAYVWNGRRIDPREVIVILKRKED